MRMIVVTVLVITGLLATLITGFTAHLVTNEFMDSVINGTAPGNENVEEVFEVVEAYGANIGLICTIGGVIGLVVWWFLSSQQRETVTGVYG